jgi:ADP-ribosylglycohydrolase
MTNGHELGKLSPVERSRLALEGLSIGDAFGQRFFVSPSVVESLLAARAFPAPPWCWTDDTAMALSVHEVLAAHGKIDRDALAALFAARYRADPVRGYGVMAHAILQAIGEGTHWNQAARQAFGGQGSMGNGSAMRVAPVGGYFADDLEQVVVHAQASADPTHAHPDAKAGAVAVAIAAAVAWQMGCGVRERSGEILFREVIARTPAGPTRDGVERAAALALDLDPRTAVDALGNGSQVICSDTVPFSLWCAARHLDDFEEALWSTVSGLGDRDTTCAIVGGIVSLCVGPAGIPEAFASAREPLDALPTGLEGTGRAG